MIASVLLFAANGGDLVEFVLAVIFLIIIGLGKLLSAIQEAKEAARKEEEIHRSLEESDRVAKRRRASGTPVMATLATPETPANDEVEEFLQKAKERRIRRRTVRTARTSVAVAAATPVVADVISASSTEKPIGDEVASHVQQYLSDDEFSRRERELGDEVAVVDRELEQHMHQVFDHQVSKLEATPGEAAVAPTAVEPVELAADASSSAPPELAGVTVDVFALLSDPSLAGQAIVLNEILRRPEERWG